MVFILELNRWLPFLSFWPGDDEKLWQFMNRDTVLSRRTWQSLKIINPFLTSPLGLCKLMWNS